MPTILPEGKQSFTNSAGAPLAGGKLYTYDAGTSTPRPTYQDAAGTTPNANPVIMDARGEALIFWSGAYKVTLKDASDATIWTVDNIVSTDAAAAAISASLAGSGGSGLVGFLPSGGSAVGTTVQKKLRESVSVKDFGAVGDGVTNDTASIQAAVNYANTNQVPLFFPGGTYKLLTAVNLPGKVRLCGTGGFNNSVLVGYSASIFSYASIDDAVFDSLTFQGATPGCAAFRQTTLTSYTSNTVWRNCVFFYSLTECIYANMILCTIDGNTFGYYGPVTAGQTAHRHIYCKGDSAGGSVANINRITNNRFYNANGVTESCYFESGCRLQIWSNDFETNATSALTIAGMYASDIQYNWFENNVNQYVINLKNNTSGSIGNYVTVIENNRFTSAFAGAYIASMAGSSTISSFSHNVGTGTFFQVTPGNASILKSEANSFTGTMALPANCLAGISGADYYSAANVVVASVKGDASSIAFNVGSATAEKVRISSTGRLLVNTTVYTSGQDAVQIGPTPGTRAFSSSSVATVNQILFDNPNGSVGSIQTSGSATSYGTSSDYRLKDNVAPMSGALSKIMSLNPVTYSWRVDGSPGEGFIAHELQEVSPNCVSGEKDAIDENGKPMYQSIDTSFLIATLVSALQEHNNTIRLLSTRVSQLEKGIYCGC